MEEAEWTDLVRDTGVCVLGCVFMAWVAWRIIGVFQDIAEIDVVTHFSGGERQENPKEACGRNKPPLHLIPASAEIAESLVMGLGAEKYGPFNWRRDAINASTYVAAARRHLAAWFDGEDNDPESGISHLAHVRSCMGIVLDAISVGKINDDRPTKGAAARLIRENTKE